MAGTFVSRHEKSTWGVPCNQRADGELFVGKGYGTSFDSQFVGLTARIRKCLRDNRADRNGRFWVNVEKKTIRMAVGESADNEYKTASF
jgi:hypothetical protein